MIKNMAAFGAAETAEQIGAAGTSGASVIENAKTLATVEKIATVSEPVEKAVFCGLTANQLALGAGIIIGAAACYAGYRIYKSKLADKDQDTASLFSTSKTLKSISELKPKSEKIENVTSSTLKEWFEDNAVDIQNAKLMIALPNKQTLKSIGYDLDDDVFDLGKCLIQSIYNSKDGTVYKFRFIEFENIDSKLQAKLVEDGGLVILDQ